MGKRKAPLAGASGHAPGALPTEAEEIPLTWNEERFVEEAVTHGNATLAYRNAYPGSPPMHVRSAASKLAAKPYIKAAIELRKDADREAMLFDRRRALQMLVAMATASLDDFSDLFEGPQDKENYRGLGFKRHALESAKRTVIRQEDGTEREITEVKIISPGERRAVINDLWEKLGLGSEGSSGNWLDGLRELLGPVRGKAKSE